MTELASEQVIISSPMSFSGSTARIWRITHTNNAAIKWLIAIPLAICFILTAWSIILCWYMLFGVFLIPYRLLRRSQRKAKKRELQHRELLAALQDKR
jgi:hypothetical protein